MDVRHLRHVMAIHRAGSFAKAAEALGIAQSTLSKSVARLEDQLGLPLFERSGAGAVATPMGLVVAGRAQRIIGEAERLRRDVELAAAGEVGEICIGVGPALRPVFLPEFTLALTRRWPRLRTLIDVESRDRLVADFRQGRYDIIFTAYADELDAPDHVITEVLRDPVLAVAAPDHPLARLPVVSVNAFLDFPNAGSTATSMLTAVGAVLKEPPTAPQTTSFQCSDDATTIALARAGVATAFFPRNMIRAELAAGQLVPLALDWRLTLKIVAVTTRAASTSPLVAAIVSMACAVASGDARAVNAPSSRRAPQPRGRRSP